MGVGSHLHCAACAGPFAFVLGAREKKIVSITLFPDATITSHFSATFISYQMSCLFVVLLPFLFDSFELTFGLSLSFAATFVAKVCLVSRQNTRATDTCYVMNSNILVGDGTFPQ